MILIFGTGQSALDVSAYVETGFKINTEGVFDNGFTAVDGTEHKQLKGYKVRISAALGNIPSSVLTSLSSLCSNAQVSVSYAYGGASAAKTAYFFTPSISAEMITEGGTSAYGDIWDVSIDMTSVTLDCL